MFNIFRRHKEEQDLSEIFLIVGLGNPGREYTFSRHNIGFMVIDDLAEEFGIKTHKYQSRAMTGRATFNEKRVILAKPQTFMNNSGASVRELIRFFKVEPGRVLVIHDDVDLTLGSLRLRAVGSSGGHRGMDSIILDLGMNTFPRMRIGIGRPPGRMDTAHYVLEGFLPSEQDVLEITRSKAVQAVKTFLDLGIEKAMNDFNNTPAE
jgi:peptidyl-tRNA hydrolase, PTH1 family